jgi:glutamate-1-semialdehyde 2,1-aminomutase
MLGAFFTRGPVRNFEEAKGSDLNRFSEFYQGMLYRGIYLAPSQFEVMFVSAAHDEQSIDRTIAAAEAVFQSII